MPKITNAALKAKAMAWTVKAKAIRFGIEAPRLRSGLKNYINGSMITFPLCLTLRDRKFCAILGYVIAIPSQSAVRKRAPESVS